MKPSIDMVTDTITFTTSGTGDTALATCTEKNVSYTDCTELLAAPGGTSHWRVLTTVRAGTVEILALDGGWYEIYLTARAMIQTHRTLDGTFLVKFKPSDVIKVLALDDSHPPRELTVTYISDQEQSA